MRKHIKEFLLLFAAIALLFALVTAAEHAFTVMCSEATGAAAKACAALSNGVR